MIIQFELMALENKRHLAENVQRKFTKITKHIRRLYEMQYEDRLSKKNKKDVLSF